MSAQFDAASIARLSLHDPNHFSIQHSQTVHRLVLLQHWNIATGSKVLELGCGQGDCTTVLAHTVGVDGRVVAVDPAQLDNGASFNFYPAGRAGGRAEGSALMLLQVPRIPSAKHRLTSRKARWVDGLLGSNNLRWTTFPPSPPRLPPRRHPLATARPSTQQCSPTVSGTFPPPRSFFPLSALSGNTASVSSLPSGR